MPVLSVNACPWYLWYEYKFPGTWGKNASSQMPVLRMHVPGACGTNTSFQVPVVRMQVPGYLW